MISPPAFWSRKGGRPHPLVRLLAPAGRLYSAAVRRKLARAKGAPAPVPVLCVGNVTMGGVGKTPFVDFLAGQCADLGYAPYVLTRGYGGSEQGPVLAAPDHTAAEIGDEAVMLAERWPVMVSRDRFAGAYRAADLGAEVIIMDDGFQNPSVEKTLSFVLIDAETGLGNQEVFPAGPLRERAEDALDRAHAIVLVGDGNPDLPMHDLFILRAGLESDLSCIALEGPVHAFSGIGRPEKFFRSLKKQGVDVAAETPFADHHPFTHKELRELREAAACEGRRLVTTEKDYARLSPRDRDGITAVPASLTVAPMDVIDLLLTRALTP